MQNYTRYDAQSFYDAMIFNMDSLGKYMLELILHQQRTPQLLKQNVGTPVVQKSGIQCYNCKEYGHVSRECQKPKRNKLIGKVDMMMSSEEQKLEAHYLYMGHFKRNIPEQPESYSDEQDETDGLDKQRDLLASLIQKLKCEIEDRKQANNELSKTNQLMFKDLKKFQAELDKYNDVNYASKVEIDCAKAKGDLMS
ncbi:reverse transcriptase domain-containing protein [Tanacetum coccineum]